MTLLLKSVPADNITDAGANRVRIVASDRLDGNRTHFAQHDSPDWHRIELRTRSDFEGSSYVVCNDPD